MSDTPFTLNPRDPILEITLSKGKANVISAEDSRQLNLMWEDFRDNPEQRFGILTGKGEKFFCAGWDLKNVAESGEASDSDYG
ncbi:MAG: enoyl-CoA hydratase-related protein, partial [SAR324 cluster bacterium]|nr:enoyl-CoA hydratase-related protein [SAR324 cluster bacterium]